MKIIFKLAVQVLYVAIKLLLSGEKQEHLHLCAYNSAFLAKAAHVSYSKVPKGRETTDGGELRLRLSEAKNPRNKRINKTKP